MFDFAITLSHVFVILGLLMILAELMLGIQTGLDLVLVGSILVVSGLLGVAFNSTVLALILSIALGFIYIAVGRKKIKRKFTSITTRKTNIDRLIGATATVVRDITPETAGIVRHDDEQWRATSDEVLYAGDTVTIETIEGVTVNVRKLIK